MNIISLEGGLILSAILVLISLLSGMDNVRKYFNIQLSLLLSCASLAVMLIFLNNAVVLEITSFIMAFSLSWSAVLILNDFLSGREVE